MSHPSLRLTINYLPHGGSIAATAHSIALREDWRVADEKIYNKVTVTLLTEKGSLMELQGSCHCGVVRFRVDSTTPYPYMACYCSICRKTAGSGGYAINLGGDSFPLKVEGVIDL